MFENKVQKKVYEKVGDYLKQSFGESFRPSKDRPLYLGLSGSAIVQVAVYPWGDDDAVVHLGSCCVRDIELVPELLEFLLTQNYNFRFGLFSIDGDGDICFEHTIVGSALDKNELAASVRAVSQSADKYDDEITRRWGGMTGLDKVREE